MDVVLRVCVYALSDLVRVVYVVCVYAVCVMRVMYCI